jgi:hypothetical protein
MTLTKNIATMATEVAKHIIADAVIQGTYWDVDNQKGCFIGCLGYSSNPASAAERYGLTLPLLRIAESIFESLPADEAQDFFGAFPDAVARDDKDLGLVHWQFLAAELRALPPVFAEIQAVIDPVITGMELIASGYGWPVKRASETAAAATDAAAWAATDAAADAAAWAETWAKAWAAASAAADAAWAAKAADASEEADAAAWAAADAAAWAADAAAWAAADAAAWAADAAAHGARLQARRRQRDTLLQLVSQAPVVEVSK